MNWPASSETITVSGRRQFEEVEPAFGRARAEPGEMIIADLGADLVCAPVTGASVIHADPGRTGQAGAQHGAGLINKPVLPSDQEAHELALGDPQAETGELFEQPRDGDLALVVLCQHEAAQAQPEMADNL